MATMVPSPRHRRIQQLANMLRDVYVVKTREYYCFCCVFISYFKARFIVDALCLSVCGLHQQGALRVSYSQRAALRL
jgi:hypothetical protein